MIKNLTSFEMWSRHALTGYTRKKLMTYELWPVLDVNHAFGVRITEISLVRRTVVDLKQSEEDTRLIVSLKS